ncbi:MAG: hypothetical protein VKO21_08990 [Candidatus Sericytochromatia bacterium]|nr:hypothetical protein [Candidatus Sericytochromatia bacterium]
MTPQTQLSHAVLPDSLSRKVLSRVHRLEALCREQRSHISNLRQELAQVARERRELCDRLAEREEHLERTVLLQAFRPQPHKRVIWPFSLASR